MTSKSNNILTYKINKQIYKKHKRLNNNTGSISPNPKHNPKFKLKLNPKLNLHKRNTKQSNKIIFNDSLKVRGY